MNDRLNDLDVSSTSLNEVKNDRSRVESTPMRTRIRFRRGGKKNKKQGEMHETASMTCFFEDVEKIKDDVAVLKQATKKILGEFNERALRATSKAEEDEASSTLKSLVGDTNKRLFRAKKALAQLNDENQKLRDSQGNQNGSDLRYVQAAAQLCFRSVLILIRY